MFHGRAVIGRIRKLAERLSRSRLPLVSHLTNTYDNGIDDLEERGYLASTKFYEAMQNVEKQNIDIQKKELDSLVKSMSEAVNSGEIKEGSEAWYDMQNDINSVKEAIQESETALVKFQNSIRETKGIASIICKNK